ncbi:MAG: FCD domain-containing protein, partial [Burkholderiaceae bacterium]|nr:FCD domain-containing protein [Burkholderiaceae bacterium]
VRRVMGAVLQAEGQRDAVWDEHAAIAQAIADGDGARAAALTGSHGDRAAVMVIERLTANGA